MVKEQIKIPVIAAGGIANGRGMLCRNGIGADAVQVGSRFAASMESSAHDNFKKTIIETKEGGTTYIKGIGLRSVNKEQVLHDVQALYEKCPTKDELVTLGRARQNEGCLKDLIEGELRLVKLQV
jgi:enoyl-[acyl-carrier protein] reductase II